MNRVNNATIFASICLRPTDQFVLSVVLVVISVCANNLHIQSLVVELVDILQMIMKRLFCLFLKQIEIKYLTIVILYVGNIIDFY
jgi:hypothetical protein